MTPRRSGSIASVFAFFALLCAHAAEADAPGLRLTTINVLGGGGVVSGGGVSALKNDPTGTFQLGALLASTDSDRRLLMFDQLHRSERTKVLSSSGRIGFEFGSGPDSNFTIGFSLHGSTFHTTARNTDFLYNIYLTDLLTSAFIQRRTPVILGAPSLPEIVTVYRQHRVRLEGMPFGSLDANYHPGFRFVDPFFRVSIMPVWTVSSGGLAGAGAGFRISITENTSLSVEGYEQYGLASWSYVNNKPVAVSEAGVRAGVSVRME